jgi:predicted O-methyltransferase YrrM
VPSRRGALAAAAADEDVFTRVDRYIEELFVPSDAALETAVRASREAGLPPIQVSPSQGKLLYLLARLRGARRILELGTLGGYSAIWLARALPPDGRLVSLELDENHADVARASLLGAGLADRSEVIVGPALRSLSGLVARGEAPFDMVFIDADKGNYTAYLEWALRLTKPGSLIAADNVVRDGSVLDEASKDESAQAARAFNAVLAAESRLEALVLQQVGPKGHDGLALAVVKERGE